MYDWIGFWSRLAPHKVAIIDDQRRQSYTYGTINERAEACCTYFSNELELQKGDRICVLAYNCVEYVILFAVAQKMGLILVPLNYRSTPSELSYFIEDAEPCLICAQSELSCQIEKVDRTLQTFDLNDIHSLIRSEPEFQYQLNQPISDDDPLFILYTSGSTGRPKGSIYTHKMLRWNSQNTSISLGLHGDSCSIQCAPPYHTGGWNVLLTPIIQHGGCTILLRKFDAKRLLDVISQQAFPLFFGVPTMLRMMAAEEHFKQIDLSALKYIIVGGEALPIELIARYESKNIRIRQGYGMTEVGPNLTSLREESSRTKIGSIGKPNLYVQYKLVNPDNQIVEPGQEGEICFRGPVVSPGYWKSGIVNSDHLKDGWFHTGDIAIEDEEGFLYIVDRLKNMYISGGENVYPAEVEKVICSDSQVSAAAVIGMSNEQWGEVGIAFVSAKNDEIDRSQLYQHCLRHLSKFKIPKYLVLLDELPLNSTGKVDRAQLKRLTQDLNRPQDFKPGINPSNSSQNCLKC